MLNQKISSVKTSHFEEGGGETETERQRETERDRQGKGERESTVWERQSMM